MAASIRCDVLIYQSNFLTSVAISQLLQSYFKIKNAYSSYEASALLMEKRYFAAIIDFDDHDPGLINTVMTGNIYKTPIIGIIHSIHFKPEQVNAHFLSKPIEHQHVLDALSVHGSCHQLSAPCDCLKALFDLKNQSV